MAELALGRLVPPDWEHVDRYPLTAEVVSELSAAPRPMVIGVNWYSAFDDPVQDAQGHWWIGRGENLGQVRGGHALCLKPRGQRDPTTWWDFYNQVSEGICVSEGVSRAASQYNRRMYQPAWLYAECKKRDGYDGWGTWVRVGLEVLKDLGHVPRKRSERHYFYEDFRSGAVDLSDRVVAGEGISAYRWARSIDDALAVLGYGDKDYVDLLNSWGRSYPHLVRMPAAVLERLWNEDGEVGVSTDR